MAMVDRTQKLLAKAYAPAVQHRLARLPSRDQLPIASWLIQTPIGTNYALQILENLEDLSKREESRPSAVLNRVLGAVQNDNLQPKEMGRRIRDCLHQSLHPTSEEHLARYREFEKQLKLPKGVRLVPPKNFEGTTFSLEIKFEAVPELREKLSTLSSATQDSLWKKIAEF